MQSSLNETYTIGKFSWEIYAKSGKYLSKDGGEWGDGYVFAVEGPINSADYDTFSIGSKTNLTDDVGLEIGDRISIAQFGKTQGFFLVYNHRNSLHKYYPAAVEDLDPSCDEFTKTTFVEDILLPRRFKKAANQFQTTATFASVLRKLHSK